MINNLLNIIDGKQAKLTIKAFSDKNRTKPIDGAEFQVMFNPTQYTKTYATDYVQQKTIGCEKPKVGPQNTQANTFNFEFLIDGTGASGEKVEVSKKVKEFLEVAYNYAGKPGKKYLKLKWVNEIAGCVLTNVDINYTMFRSDGSPLRATIKAAFKEDPGYKPKPKGGSDSGSSTMTDIMKTIKKGEKIAAVVHTLYGNSDRLAEIALKNGLDSIRGVPPGTALLFSSF